jgi:tetratricopeptide (TPR) repeat protein
MANTLSAASWKKFLQSCTGVDKSELLTKALEKYDKLDSKATPADKVAATMAVVEQAQAVLKKNPKNDKLEKHLNEVIKEANAEKVGAQVALKKEEEEGEEGPEDKLKGMLKIAKGMVRDKAFEFVFAPFKKVGGLVVAHKISAGHAKKAWALRDANLEKTIKNKKRIDGLCYGKVGGASEEGDDGGEDLKGKIVFELPEEPKAGLAKALVATIMAQTGKKMKVTVKGPNSELTDDQDTEEMVEEEGREDSTEETSASVDPALVEQVRELSAKVAKLLETLKAADATKATPFATRYGEALGHEKGERFGVALSLLQSLDGELRDAVETASRENEELKAEWDRRVGSLGDALKSALVQKNDTARDIRFYYNEARSLAGNGQYRNALGELTKVENLLRTMPTTVTGSDSKDAVERAKALATRFKEMVATDPSVSRFAPDVAHAAKAAQDKAEDALEQIEYVEGLLNSAARAAAALKDILAGGTARTAGFRKARDDWEKARNLARTQMGKFEQAITSDPEVQELDEWPIIEKAAALLVPMLDVFDGSLAQAITEAEDTDPEVQRGGVELAAHLIREYRLELEQNAVLGAMDSGEFGTYKVHELLTKSLDQVAAKLGV